MIGISPALSESEHLNRYGSPTDGFDVLIYTGSGLMGREVVNIRSSDIVLIVGGQSGTLGEFSIAYDEGRLIGVLEGSGGIADLLPQIIGSLHKHTGSVVIYDDNPQRLVQTCIEYYENEHFRHPHVFHANGSATAAAHRSTGGPMIDNVTKGPDIGTVWTYLLAGERRLMGTRPKERDHDEALQGLPEDRGSGRSRYRAHRLLWWALAIPALVKYPTDAGATPRYAGTFTVYVDQATMAPLAQPQALPLTIERRIQAIDDQSGSSKVLVDETITQQGR